MNDHTGTETARKTDVARLRAAVSDAVACDVSLDAGMTAIEPESFGHVVREISALIDAHYPLGLDREAHLLRRVIKVTEEAGEAVEALLGALGENLRKGQTHTMHDVRRELLDVALAALAAICHFDNGDPGDHLDEHARSVHARLRAVTDERVASVVADRTTEFVPPTEVAALAEAVMARLHPEFDLYGSDAQDAALDQVDDIVLLAQQYQPGCEDGDGCRAGWVWPTNDPDHRFPCQACKPDSIKEIRADRG